MRCTRAVISAAVGTGTGTNRGRSGILSSGASLTFNSDFALGASTVVSIDIGGATVSQYGRLIAPTSAVVLVGSLNVFLTGGYVPLAGDAFDVVTWNQRNGEFGNINLPDLGGGVVFDVDNLPGSLRLTTP